MRIPPVNVVALASALALIPPSVCAQDPLRGKRLYLDTARMTGSPVSCVDCHGGMPRGLFGIGRAADDAHAVARALSSVPQMIPLRGRLSASDVADVASYLARPDVQSPSLKVVAKAPAVAATTDRLAFGSTRPGQRSIAATVRLVNEGVLAMGLESAARIVGPDAADFLIASASCGSGTRLGPGGACEMAVLFQPTPGRSGLRTAALQVDHDWVGAMVGVALLGTAE